MTRPLFDTLLVLLAIAGVGCARGYDYPTWNGYSMSDVIVEGRVTGWDTVAVPTPHFGDETVAIHVDVDKVIKGTAGSQQIDVIDVNSVHRRDGKYDWMEVPCGDCYFPTLETDPTDHYIIVGLKSDLSLAYPYLSVRDRSDPRYAIALGNIDKDRAKEKHEEFENALWIGGTLGGLVLIGLILALGSMMMRRRRERGERRGG